MKPIHLPLTPISASKYTRSYMRTTLLILFCIICAFICARIYFTIDRVSNLRSENTDISIFLLKSSSIVEQFSEKTASKAVLGTLTLSQLLSLTHYGLALHLSDAGEVLEVTLDRALTQKEAEILQHSGLYVYKKKNNTLIGLHEFETPQPVRWNFDPWMIFPWNDGAVRTAQETYRLSVNNKHIIIHNISRFERAHTKTLNLQADEIIAKIHSTQGEYELSHILSPLRATPIAELLEGNQSFELLLGTREEIYVFSILLEIDLTPQALIGLSQTLAGYHDLSTTALTMSDGTKVKELIGDTNPAISLEQESSSTFVHIQGENFFYRLAQSPAGLYITNTDSAPIFDTKKKEGVCVPHAHTFLDLQKLAVPFPILSAFDSLAITRKNLVLCW